MIYWTFSNFLSKKKLSEGLYCISVTGKKNAKNPSTGPNKFSKQYPYAPEFPIEAIVFICAVTTTCSIPPASNYTVATQKH